MKIEVYVSRYIKKYIEYTHPKPITFKRTNVYAMLFFAQRKFNGGESRTINSSRTNLNDVIYIHLSTTQFLYQRMKGKTTLTDYVAFNNIVRDFFYKDFFNYMDFRLFRKKLVENDNRQIKDIVQDYMTKLCLSDDDILLETLLRNYRRYRTDPNIDLYELIESLVDE